MKLSQPDGFSASGFTRMKTSRRVKTGKKPKAKWPMRS